MNDTLPRVAVIGCGYWGKNLVRNMRDLGALAMVCDATDAGRRLAAEIAPAAPVVDCLDDVLADSIDAVMLATPAETHHDLALRVLSAGKHVFCEKPLATTYSDGLAMVQAAEEANRTLMVGHVLEYHPGIERLCSLIGEGALGKVRYIYSNRLSLGKVRREENALWSFAPHDIAVILRIVGDLPFQVVACGGSYVQPNIADVTVTQLLFDNGVRAHIFVSWLHPFKEQRLVVVGSHKMASFDDVSKQLVLYDQRVDVANGEPLPIKGEGQRIDYSDEEPLRRECQAFLDAVQSGQSPRTDGPSGLRVLKVLQAAQRSLVTNGEPVDLPLELAR